MRTGILLSSAPPERVKRIWRRRFGYECCQHRLKTYFIKASELRDKFTAARRSGQKAATLTSLVRPSCLIIDEVSHCEFDKENTRLFFDMIDRRYNKEGAYNIVFTSNKALLFGGELQRTTRFSARSAASSTDATVFNIRGESFRESDWKPSLCPAGQGVLSRP